MKIKINGEEKIVTSDDIKEILKKYGPNHNFFSISLNKSFLSRTNYNKKIKEGDEIEIITPHPGG